MIERQDIEVIQAMQREYREEVGKLGLQLAVYRKALEDNGIEPPDMSGAALLQMWRDTAAVLASTSEFIHHLGTAKEMLETWR